METPAYIFLRQRHTILVRRLRSVALYIREKNKPLNERGMKHEIHILFCRIYTCMYGMHD